MDIIENLPNYIVQDLVLELYSNDINKIKLFKEAETSFIVNLLPLCRPFESQPEEIIFKEGDICNEIVFIKQGTIRILSNNGQKDILVGIMTEGGMFGDAEYYRNTTSIATYSTAKYCQFLSVGHATLSLVLEDHYTTSHSFNGYVKDRYFGLMSVIRSRSIAEVEPAVTGNKKAMDDSRLVRGKRGTSGTFQDIPTSFDDSSIVNHPVKSNSNRSFLSTNHPTTKRQPYSMKRSICIDGLVCDLATNMYHLDLDSTAEASINLNYNSTIRVVIVKDNKEIVREYPIEILKIRKLIHPQGYYKVRWDLYIGCLIIYSVLIIPIEIAFSGNAFDNHFAWNTVIDVCFFIDIILCFRTCFISNDYEAMVIDNTLIAKQYINGLFIIDLLSTFPFDAILIAAGNETTGKRLAATQLIKTFRILRLLKLLRIFKLGNYIERIEDATGISPVIFQLFALLVQVFFVVHLACCLYWGLTDSISSNPWYIEVVAKDTSIASRYLVALYFTFTTITTVGYGDLGPSKTGEQLVCIFLVLTGASIFGYMIANVSSVLSSLDSDGTSTEQMTEITEYLNEKHCSINLRYKILNHFQKQYQDKTIYDVEQMTNCLPPGLRTELLIALNGKRMNKIPIFKYIINQSVSLYLFRLMNPSYYEDGHYIIKEGNEADDIVFLIKGHARAFKICKEPVKIILPSKPLLGIPKRDLHPNDRIDTSRALNGDSDQHIQLTHHMTEPIVASSRGGLIRDEIQLSVNQADRRQYSYQSPSPEVNPVQTLDLQQDTREVSPKASRLNILNVFTSKKQSVEEQDSHSIDGELDLASIYPDKDENAQPVTSKQSPISKMFGRSTSPASPHHLSPPKASNPVYKAVASDEGPEIEMTHVNSEKGEGARSGAMGLLKNIAGSVKNSFNGSATTNDNAATSSSSRLIYKHFFSSKKYKSMESMTFVDTAGSKGSAQQNLTSTSSRFSKLLSQKTFSAITSRQYRTKTDNLDQLGKPFELLTDSDFLDHGYKLLGDVNPGDFVGHIAFLTTDNVHDASVRTTVPSTVYTLSKHDIQKLVRVEPTVGIQLQSALSRATIAQANDVGRFHMRSNRAAFLKDLKSQYFDIHYPKSGAADADKDNLSEPSPSQVSHNPRNGSSRRAVDTANGISESPRSDPINARHSVTDLVSNGKLKSGTSGRSSMKRNSMFGINIAPPVERKPRVVEKLFQHERILYNSDDEDTQTTNNDRDRLKAAIAPASPTAISRSISQRVVETFQRQRNAPSNSLTRSKSAPIASIGGEISAVNPTDDSLVNQPSASAPTLSGSPQQPQNERIAPQSPLGNTRSAVKHWLEYHSAAATPVTGTTMLPRYYLWQKLFAKPKPIEEEVCHLQRSVSLSELEDAMSNGLNSLQTSLQTSEVGMTSSAIDNSGEEDDSDGSMGYSAARSQRERNIKTRNKRRQTFPSRDNDLWRLQKLHQGVVF